jgi:hypothetical protein
MKCGKKSKLFLLCLGLCLLASSPLFSSVDQPEDPTMGTPQTLALLPTPPTLSLPDSAPLNLRLAEALQAWVTWYKVDLTQWRAKLTSSFRVLRDSYEKQQAQTQKTIESKDAVIAALRVENSILRGQLRDMNTSATIGWTVVGVSGLINIVQAGVSLIPK